MPVAASTASTVGATPASTASTWASTSKAFCSEAWDVALNMARAWSRSSAGMAASAACPGCNRGRHFDLVQITRLKTAPEWIVRRGNRLLVRAYDTDYEFALR